MRDARFVYRSALDGYHEEQALAEQDHRMRSIDDDIQVFYEEASRASSPTEPSEREEALVSPDELLYEFQELSAKIRTLHDKAQRARLEK